MGPGSYGVSVSGQRKEKDERTVAIIRVRVLSPLPVVFHSHELDSLYLGGDVALYCMHFFIVNNSTS